MTNDEARELVKELGKIFAEAQQGIDRLLRQQDERQGDTADMPVDESDIGTAVEVRNAENDIWQKRILHSINRKDRKRYPYRAYSQIDRANTVGWNYARRITTAKPAPPRDVEPTEQHIGKLVFVRDNVDRRWIPGILKSGECGTSHPFLVTGTLASVPWKFARLPYPGEIEALLPTESRETHHA